MRYFEPYDNTIYEMAKVIRWQNTDYVMQLTESMEMIAKAIKYNSDIITCGLRDCKTSASNALRTGEGDCEEMAAAVASLLRAIDLQENRLLRQRIVLGWFRRSFNEKWDGHVWAEAWDEHNIYVLETTADPPIIYSTSINENPYKFITNYIPMEYKYT